ncbi:hypothetical protein PYJP_03600 [Pyrofollis japonicus]|uniref:hypothetical protein n=1 Tax=Pyrofollis japonicus TaxID=3060460 RepID=UPI00295B5E9F|nr:hypothetical protein [Pyrofollis japonicus]BEP17008.1 hypothetical protein PYJP_03600 [Pyrofollis japonicus]
MVAEADMVNKIKDSMKKRGLVVEERKSIQRTLDGKALDYHAVMGYKEGIYKITVRLSPKPMNVQLVVNAKDNKQADNIAGRLGDEVGINVDVDDEVVRGKTYNVTLQTLRKIIDIVEEETNN